MAVGSRMQSQFTPLVLSWSDFALRGTFSNIWRHFVVIGRSSIPAAQDSQRPSFLGTVCWDVWGFGKLTEMTTQNFQVIQL